VHALYAQPSDRWRKRAAVYGLERLAASSSDAELVQNPEDVAVMKRLGIAPRKLYPLGNGIDLDRFDPARHGGARSQVRADVGVAEREVLVGLVGRLVAEKGYREVFEAARRLRETHPNVRFVVAGPSEFDKADAIGQDELDRAVDVGVHPRHAPRNRAAVPGPGSVGPRLAPGGLPPFCDGGRRDGLADGDD
jgi:glycosyltransferase involved in cell wall biosynthesis